MAEGLSRTPTLKPTQYQTWCLGTRFPSRGCRWVMVLPKSGSFAAAAGGASPGRCTQRATVSPCCGDVRGGDGEGCSGSKRLPPYSLYLQQPRAEQSVLEQRCHFPPLHPQPRWGRDEERRPSRRDKPQFPQKPARPSPGAGEIRIGPIPPAWLLQQEWGDFPPPTSASATPGVGRKQISTEETLVGK